MGIEPTEDASQRPPPVLKTGPRTSHLARSVRSLVRSPLNRCGASPSRERADPGEGGARFPSAAPGRHGQGCLPAQAGVTQRAPSVGADVIAIAVSGVEGSSMARPPRKSARWPLVLALVALAVAPSAARASVLWSGDFSTGDLSQWEAIE